MSSHKGKFKSCEVETISSKLKFVGMLEAGQKIGVSTQTLQDNSYVTSFVRYMNGENRVKVYRFISDLLKDAFSVLDSYANSSDKHDIRICKNMIIDLINLRPGLENLKSTYRSDQKYLAQLQTMIENLQVQTEKLCNDHLLDFEEIKVEAEERRQAEMGTPLELPLEEQSSDDEEEVPEDQEDQETTEVLEDKLRSVNLTEEVEPDVEVNPSSFSKTARSKGKKKKHSHQYDSYYVTKSEDIHLYRPELHKGLIQ